MNERLPQALLGCVLVSGLILLAAAATPEPPGGVAVAHPEYPSLLVAAADARVGAGGLALGWALGAVQAAFFCGCFALGMRRRGSLGALARPVWIGAALYQLGWAGLALCYHGFSRDPAAPLFGSLPAPTAWMLYGLWPLPLWFAVIFWRHFDAAFLSQRDLEAFRARLDALGGVARD